MSRDPALARQIWQRLELIHAVTYFSPEPIGALREAGYKGFWMGYFAGRAAPLGAVGPEIVTALFYNFAPSRVARALPDAWSFAPPERALEARLDGSVAALRRSLGEVDVADVAALARRAAESAPSEGRTLFAANSVLPWPDDPLAALVARRHVAPRAPRRRACGGADGGGNRRPRGERAAFLRGRGAAGVHGHRS